MSDKILERVRKMLALANDKAATEQERDTALQMAYKTLAHHNLAMVDVENHQKEEDPRNEFNMICFGMPWARQICNALAGLFFCRYYYGEKINATQKRHHFVGKESNATTAMLMSTYVINSILKEARNRYTHNLCPESRSFATGASNRLWKRAKELREAQERETKDATSGRELVLANLYDQEFNLNEEFIKSKGTEIIEVKNRAQPPSDRNAYQCGHEFGGKINLSSQLSDSIVQPKSIK